MLLLLQVVFSYEAGVYGRLLPRGSCRGTRLREYACTNKFSLFTLGELLPSFSNENATSLKGEANNVAAFASYF